ncbi:hypothetical protein J2X20_002294 [Pelomonas saccharophila]|uniref:Uncharacterized protein n=1 Tax=Roseateles saccharophilus TaxID=304 RepID=A0ABU1YLE0_ROSSA|nr:hypothetical protein [Roseateles saccharophilus]MDR7269665.1 hypothetical protein [Roseateles saccharophilus]
MESESRDDSSSSSLFSVTRFVSFCLVLVGALILSRGVWTAYTAQPITEVSALLGAGLVLLLAGTIDRFETLKGLGFEAKTREIKRQLSEAGELVDQLRELSVMAFANLIKQSALAGRWDSAPTFGEEYKFAMQAREKLGALEVDNLTIKGCLKPWVDMVLWDWASEAVNPWRQGMHQVVMAMDEQARSFQAAGDTQAAETLRQQARDLGESGRLRVEALYRGPRASLLPDLRNLLRSEPRVADDIQRAALDWIESWQAEIEHLLKHSELQTPERWLQQFDK